MAGFLALDWGAKKVGYATADTEGLVVTPRGHFIRKAQDVKDAWKLTAADLKKLQELVSEFESDTVILGQPLAIDGGETEGSRLAKGLAKEIETRLMKPVKLINEALSTWNANQTDPSHAKKKRSGLSDDAGAAAQLLEDHFFQMRQKRQKGSAFTSLLLLIFFVGLCAVAFVGVKFYSFSQTSFAALNPNLTDEVLVDVPPGSTFISLEKHMNEQGLKIDPFAMKIWLRIASAMSGARKLKVGEYLVKKEWAPLTALNQIAKGKVILHQLTLKEGDNIYDFLQLASDTVLAKPDAARGKVESFNELLHDPKLMARMGVPVKAGSKLSLEGFLFPETYSFQKYDTPRILVEAMLHQFEIRALPILQQHPQGQTAEGRYRLLTLASIVEKESGVFTEQPEIAAVFWNRLNKKMRLESDPTIIYGLMPNFDGNIHREQIHAPTPYNTYTVTDLPIGPISNPGESALKAVVTPAKNGYLFFVAKGDGTHVFSDNYKTHLSYVEQYQLKHHQPASKSAKK